MRSILRKAPQRLKPRFRTPQRRGFKRRPSERNTKPVAKASVEFPGVKKLGILLSGRGSNFMAIAEAVRDGRIDAEIAVVISNREEAPGIAKGRELGLNAVVIPSKGRGREEHDGEVVRALQQHNVDLVCLAGYMRLLGPEFVRAFPMRILNIHPSLLPAFPGLDAQRQALEYGAKISGCTVHFVDEHLDAGPIILQRAVEVRDGDGVSSLSERILEQEHVAYVEALRRVIRGGWQVEGRRVVFEKHPERSEGALL